jgi:hypothetical protein
VSGRNGANVTHFTTITTNSYNSPSLHNQIASNTVGFPFIQIRFHFKFLKHKRYVLHVCCPIITDIQMHK